MRYRSILILAVLLMLFGVSQAQDNQPQNWHWAWRKSTQELLAYSADGQVNTLLKGSKVNQVLLGEGNTAMAIVSDDTRYSFYKLTDTEAIPIKADFDIKAQTDHDEFVLAMQTGSYFLIRFYPESEAILVDLKLLRAISINYGGGYSFVLSEDKQSVRFVGKADSDEKNTLRSIRELNLSTGDEHVVYQLTSPFPDGGYFSAACNPNTYGSQWLCVYEAHPNNENHFGYFLINEDGTTQLLVDDPKSNRWVARFSGDYLMLVDQYCTSECSVQVYPPGQSEPDLFAVPPRYLPLKDKHQVVGIDVVNDGIVLFTVPDILRLYNDGTSKYLGQRFCCEVVITWSPDHHWSVLANGGLTKARVWDIEKDQLVFEIPVTDMVTKANYFERGFTITDLYAPQSWAYLYSTRQLVQISHDTTTIVTDILPDDTFLVDEISDGGDRDVGIYRYDPATGQFTLLVADAHNFANFN